MSKITIIKNICNNVNLKHLYIIVIIALISAILHFASGIVKSYITLYFIIGIASIGSGFFSFLLLAEEIILATSRTMYKNTLINQIIKEDKYREIDLKYLFNSPIFQVIDIVSRISYDIIFAIIAYATLINANYIVKGQSDLDFSFELISLTILSLLIVRTFINGCKLYSIAIKKY